MPLILVLLARILLTPLQSPTPPPTATAPQNASQPAPPPSDERIQQMLTRGVAIHKRWGSAMNAPGVSADVREVSRKLLQGQEVVSYEVRTKGLPNDQTYNFVEVDVIGDKGTPTLHGITFGKDGLAICAGRPDTCGVPETPDDPIDFVFPVTKGEVHHLALISANGQSKVFFEIVPSPALGSDHGCTLQLDSLVPHALAVYIHGEGFVPGETLKIDSGSGNERHVNEGHADTAGSWEVAVLPVVKGANFGTLKATVQAANCAPTASIDWGVKP